MAELTAAAIALNRFGLGARLGESPPADPKAWLSAQFNAFEAAPPAWSAQPSSRELVARYEQYRQQVAGADEAARLDANKSINATTRETYQGAVNARVASALATPAPFVERLVHFWANHFAISADKQRVVRGMAGAFEVEAIRPHVLGRFEDMLVAVEQHPAMLVFLDQAQSIGPDSLAAMRRARRDPERVPGLNENLAREIMELHTLGVRSGYTQQDVTEFARALTGWSIVRAGDGPGGFMFRPAQHEPGARTIMGRRYDQPGEAQARAVLHDLATSPATARHVCTKLARHFIADDPPPEAVERLAAVFEASGGDLRAVYRALIDLPQAWSPIAVKFKTPWEWTLSALRGLGVQEAGGLQFAPILNQLGQPVWQPGSPAGFDDIAGTWAAPDALVRRVEVAQRMASRVDTERDPIALGQQMLAGSALNTPTVQAVARAETVSMAVALLLVSPDFQRR
jgi:uncharacterized protein (DUF1800 family)